MQSLLPTILIQLAYTLPALAPLVVALIVRSRCAQPGLVLGGAVTIAATGVLSFIVNAATTIAIYQGPMIPRWTSPLSIMLAATGAAGTVLLVLGAVVKQQTAATPPTPTTAG